jgi:hypothetical protein
MEIDESEHRQKAESAIHEILQPDSNVTVARDWHRQKQPPPSFSREEGIQIDRSEGHVKKAWSSIDESLESDSNVTVERTAQPANECWPSLVIDEGMQTDESDEQF